MNPAQQRHVTGPHRPPSDPWHQFVVVVMCVAGLLMLWALAGAL